MDSLTGSVTGDGETPGFDEQTEVLTWEGWKSITAVNTGDRVCSLVDGRIVYRRPTAVHRGPSGGRMYRIRSQQVDLVVAGGHRLYVKPRGTGSHGLFRPEEVFGRRVRYKKDGIWRGHSPASLVLPALRVVAGQFGHGVRELPARTIPSRLYAMLLGCFLSEGSTFAQHGGYGIDIHQVKPAGKARFEAEVRPALRAAGFNCSSGGNGKYRIHSKQLCVHLGRLGTAAAKHIPDEVLSYGQELLGVLFDWLMWGDGHTTPGGLPICYTSTSKRLVDDVQRLCLHIGKAANVQVHQPAGLRFANGGMYECRESYQSRIVNTKLEPEVNHGHVHRQAAQEEMWVEGYDRPVFGLTVPGHVIYVRRGGKAVWSGDGSRSGDDASEQGR